MFQKHRPIDTTLIRGPGLENYDGTDPWTFVLSRAQEIPEPVSTKKVRQKIEA